MKKHTHEVKDPIHDFIKFDSQEKEVINSPPFQRLRHIHQLSFSFLVYPGATHKRFEHSLGVMELTSRVYDSIISLEKITDDIKKLLHDIDLIDQDQLSYWRRVLRMAALCHDMGHLPFSHAGEGELLPEDWDHERITRAIIETDEMKSIWSAMKPPLDPCDIIKLALGSQKAKDLCYSDWETILAEIVIGDAFGVDRMDYLLRDSHHTGMVHGKFDHYRLIDTLRIMTPPPDKEDTDKSLEPSLGIEKGGLTTSEALLISRYLMFSQVYFHPISRIYNIHLTDFLLENREGRKFPTIPEQHLLLTDNEIYADILKSNRNKNALGHIHAHRIINRDHFRILYQWSPSDTEINPEATECVYNAAKEKYGDEYVKYDKLPPKGKPDNYLVYMADGRAEYAYNLSRILQNMPIQKNECVYVESSKINEALNWLKSHRIDIVNCKGD